MSEGSKKARAAQWGAKRAPSKKIAVDAEIADRFMTLVPERERREFANRALLDAIFNYL